MADKPDKKPDPRYLAPEDRAAAPVAVQITAAQLEASGMRLRFTGEPWTREAPTSFQGQSLDVEWTTPQGQSGLPWSLGQLRLETRPDLYPLQARGRRGAPGEYQRKARANPWIQNRLRQIVYPVAGAAWKVTRPDDCPDEQWDFQQGCWRAWTQRGMSYGLADWIQEAVWMALVAGFGWAEIVWPEGRAYPPLPALRDPSSVDEWITQLDTWIGVVQSVNAIDSYGNLGPVRVAIPAQKLLHWANEPVGATDLEGRSILRPAFAALQLCEDLLSLQGLSAALNAAGTWIITGDKDATDLGDKRANLEAHLQSYQAQHVPYMILPPGWDARLESPDSAVIDLTNQLRLAEQAAMTAMSGAHDLVGAYGQGSRAAREVASSDARDLLDVYAAQMARVLEQLFRRLLLVKFPDAEPIPAIVTYADVEQRDPAAQVQALATYLRDVRPSLWPDARKLYDEQFALPPEPIAAPSAEATTPPAKPAPDASLDADPTREARAAEPESLPVPKGVQEAAERALKWISQGLAGDGFTDTGRARAAQLARGGPVSPRTVRRMASYFRRHRPDRAAEGFQAGEEGYPTPGRVAWDAWGGDAGESWSQALVESWDAEEDEA